MHLHLDFPTCGKDILIHSWNPFLLYYIFPASHSQEWPAAKFQWQTEFKPKWCSSSRPAPRKSPKHLLPFSFSFYQLNEDAHSDLGGVNVGDAKRQIEPSPSITTFFADSHPMNRKAPLDFMKTRILKILMKRSFLKASILNFLVYLLYQQTLPKLIYWYILSAIVLLYHMPFLNICMSDCTQPLRYNFIHYSLPALSLSTVLLEIL